MKNESKYRSLFDNMSEGFALVKIIKNSKNKPCDYRFLEINRAWEKIFGAPKEKIVGRTALEINPDVEPYWIEGFGKAELKKKPINMEAYNGHTKKWLEVHAYPAGEKDMVAAIIDDVTERRESEKEKDNLITTMSHELRNPLTTIIIGIELIQDSLKKSPSRLTSETKHYINIINQQSKNISRLLDDLLDISRISRGKIQLKIQVSDLNNCIKNAVITTNALFKKQKHKLFVSLPQKPVRLKCDPTRIEQVFVNLLNNAAKYTPPKGTIWIEARSLNNFVEITIKDTGVGIEQESMDSVFTSFSRFSTPFVSTQGELGIGLKLAKDIVVLHGGTITAESDGKNKGSTFVIKLPTIYKKRLFKYSKENKISPQAKKLNILLVEDNDAVALMIAKTLRRQGHKLEIRNNGKSAIAFVKEKKPHVVLIDLGLPGMNGYELAREIRRMENKSKKKMKLIAITGYGNYKDKQYAKLSGFDLHLLKPVNTEILKKTLGERKRF